MIGVIYEVLSAYVKRPAGLLLTDPRVAADLVIHVIVQTPVVRLGSGFIAAVEKDKLTFP